MISSQQQTVNKIVLVFWMIMLTNLFGKSNTTHFWILFLLLNLITWCKYGTAMILYLLLKKTKRVTKLNKINHLKNVVLKLEMENNKLLAAHGYQLIIIFLLLDMILAILLSLITELEILILLINLIKRTFAVSKHMKFNRSLLLVI